MAEELDGIAVDAPTSRDAKQRPTRKLQRVRIVAIQTVADPALARFLYTVHPAHFASYDPNARDSISLAEAQRRLNGTSSFGEQRQAAGGAQVSEEPVDIDLLLLASGVDAHSADVNHDEAHEKRFKALTTALKIRMRALVEYDRADQELEMLSGDDADLLAFAPVAPRHAQNGAASASAMVRAIVDGDFPTGSTSVPLDMVVVDAYGASASSGVAHYEATRRDCSIVPSSMPRVVLGDFYTAIIEGTQLHRNAADSIVRALFPALYGRAGRLPTSLRNRAGNAPALVTDPLNNSIERAELLKLLVESHHTSLATLMPPQRVVFSTMLLLLMADKLGRLIAAYGTRGPWIDIAARGSWLVDHVCALLAALPITLCFGNLKYAHAAAEQHRAREDTVNIPVARQRSLHAASLRCLLTLPEISYRRLRLLLPPDIAMTPEIRAVDVYNSIIRHDLQAQPTYYYDDAHARRVRDSSHGVTSGHMFSVVTDHPKVSGERYDSACAEGTLKLEGVWPKPDATRANSKRSNVAVVAQHDDGDDRDDEQAMYIDAQPRANAVNFECMTAQQRWRWQLEHGRLAFTRATAAAAAAVTMSTSATVGGGGGAAASSAKAMVREWSDARSRCAHGMTPRQFEEALEWLCERRVVTPRRLTGNGPRNAGVEFDAFYLTSVHDAQSRLVAAIGDIYARGVRDAAARYCTGRPMLVASPPQRVAAFYDLLRFEQHARQALRGVLAQAVVALPAQSASSANGAPPAHNDEAETNDEVEMSGGPLPSNADALAAVLVKMRALHSAVVGYFATPVDGDGEGDDADGAKNDEYTPLCRPADKGGRRRDYRLLRLTDDVRNDPRFAQLCDEQKRAVLAMWALPITVVNGAGGTGKTHAVSVMTRAYPPEAQLATAFTRKVARVLSDRVLPADTIDSYRYRHMLYMQEMRRTRAYLARMRLRESTMSAGERELLHLRADLFRYLGAIRHPSPFAHKRLLLIDEGSLVSFDLLVHLVEAVHQANPPSSARNGEATGFFLERLIVCGDIDQCEPIGHGSVLRDLAHAMPHCVQYMTVNHRSEGRAIFSLARAIAERRPNPLGDDAFDDIENEDKLTRVGGGGGGGAAGEVTDRDSIICVSAGEATLERQLMWTLDLMGALKRTAAARALRRSIHMIATTNYLVQRTNRAMRVFCFGSRWGHDVEADIDNIGTMRMPNGIMPGEKVYLKANVNVTYPRPEITNDGIAGSASEPEPPGVNEAVVALRKARPSGAFVLARDAIMDGGIFIEDSQSSIIVRFANSEILELVCAYDAPFKILPSTCCRCGRCLVDPDAPQRQQCVLELHVVPLSRRTEPTEGDPSALRYHNERHGGGGRNGDGAHRMRRMAVFRTLGAPVGSVEERFKELDVDMSLHDRSTYEFGYATTTYKFQGSEADVIFLVCTSDSRFSTWKIAYTAVTRAKKRLVIIGDRAGLQRIIAREATMRRSDLWHDLACVVARTHTRLARIDRSPFYLVDALLYGGPDTLPSIRTLLNTQRSAGRDRSALWQLYTTHKTEAYARAAATAAATESDVAGSGPPINSDNDDDDDVDDKLFASQ